MPSDDVAYVWHFNRDGNATEHDYAAGNGAAFRPCSEGFPLRRPTRTRPCLELPKVDHGPLLAIHGIRFELRGRTIGLTGYGPSWRRSHRIASSTERGLHAISENELDARCYPPHSSQIRTVATGEAPIARCGHEEVSPICINAVYKTYRGTNF